MFDASGGCAVTNKIVAGTNCAAKIVGTEEPCQDFIIEPQSVTQAVELFLQMSSEHRMILPPYMLNRFLKCLEAMGIDAYIKLEHGSDGPFYRIKK